MGSGVAKDKTSGKPRQKHKADAWLCQSCTDIYGYPRYVFPDKVKCWTCSRAKPHKPKLYGSSSVKADGKDRKGNDAKGRDGATPTKTPLQEQAAKSKTEYLELKKLCKEDADQAAVQVAHDAWQEAEKKAKQESDIVDEEDIADIRKYVEMFKGKPGLERVLAQYEAKLKKRLEEPQPDLQSKALREAKRKLELLRKLPESPGIAESIRTAEKQVEAARVGSGPKSLSDVLRSAEARRANKAKRLEALQTDTEELRKQQAEIEAKIAAKVEEAGHAQCALDEADLDVAEKRRAVAHPLPRKHFGDAQVAAVSTQMAAYQTVMDGVRSAVTKPEVATSLPVEVKKLFDAMLTSFLQLQAAMPTELRQVPQTYLPTEAAAAVPAAATATAAWAAGAAQGAPTASAATAAAVATPAGNDYEDPAIDVDILMRA